MGRQKKYIRVEVEKINDVIAEENYLLRQLSRLNEEKGKEHNETNAKRKEWYACFNTLERIGIPLQDITRGFIK